MPDKILFRYSVLVTISVALLIFLGGLVNSTGSGLSVPDWPTTFGDNMFTYPPHKWTGGILYEHSHRLLASLVGVLTIGLVVLMWQREKRQWVRMLSYYALFAVILQGILGGVTVLLQLPPAVSIAHGIIAQSFFCLIALLALFVSPWWFDVKHDKPVGGLAKFSAIISIAIFVQLILGALLRHTYSGLAIPDFPLSYGSLFPSLDSDALRNYNGVLIAEGIKHSADRPVMGYQIIIHFIHRTWAYFIAIGVILFALKLLRSAKDNAVLWITRATISLVVIQFLLGMFTVLSRKAVIIATLHVETGALLLMSSVITTAMVYKIRTTE